MHDHDHPHEHPHAHDHLHEHDHPHPHDHEHEHDHPHVHGHGAEPDRVALTYAGLSIGSATVHSLLCRLVLASSSPGGLLHVKERHVLHRSPAFPTPYRDDGALDLDSVDKLVTLQVWEGTPTLVEDADLVEAALTGPSAQEPALTSVQRLVEKQHARAVCIPAGPHLAATIAAYGSDAVARSLGAHGEGRTVLNVDVGAIQAKFAVCVGGEVVETAVLAVGPRAVALDGEGGVLRIEPAARLVADERGIPLTPGVSLALSDQRALAEGLAELVFQVIERQALAERHGQLLGRSGLAYADKIHAVSFSGGASEYLYGSATEAYGDLGPLFGRAVRQRLNRLGIAVQEPEHVLRAGIVGAAQYEMESTHGAALLVEPASFARARERDGALVQTTT